MQHAKEKIATILQQAIGLDVSSIGEATLLRALHNRMREKGTAEVEEYVDNLRTSTLELRKLVEEVVVPETWFFRDQEPFIFLADFLFKSGKDFERDSFRILSLPCSTGEEPYSIAMTLLQAGLKPTSFFIDAVDVSERVLAIARKGFYKRNSFRSKDLSFRDIFFHSSGQGYALNDLVRNKVRFLRGNILSSAFIDSMGVYDVVFCRNVLIYFNEQSQNQAIDALYRLLMPQGILFTGHSEASLFYDSRFKAVSHSKSFAFYKQSDPSAEVQKRTSEMQRGFSNRTTQPRPSFGRFSSENPVTVSAPSPGEPGAKNDIASVRQMADRGDLHSAAALCEQHLDENGPSAEWYYLLGVIRDSQGETQEAVKLLRKALYLEPKNIESLIHLSLIAEREGEHGTAANYKRRAKRLQDGG